MSSVRFSRTWLGHGRVGQLTYRGYDVLGYRDSRTAFDAIMRQRDRIDGICVDLELCGSPEQGAELIGNLRMNGVTAPIVVLTNNLAGETEFCRAWGETRGA